MTTPAGPPRRVRVTSPRTGGTRSKRVAPAAEIDRRSQLGEVYLSTLLRAQLRLGLGVLTVVVVCVGGLPLLLRALPGLGERSVLGMPLPWVLIAFAVYPFLVLCGLYYVRRAEHNERVFAQLVQPDPQDGDR